MRYVSTRSESGDPGLPFCDILLQGLAPDGGLYMPLQYPSIDPHTLEVWRTLLTEHGYAAVAFEVLRLFADDIPEADLRGICERAYATEVFGDPVVPVTEMEGGLWLAHLSNGPTAAFKDMAMQLLGQLFEYELSRRGQVLNILGATSGDTGSAAEYAMLGRHGITVFMLSPQGRMSPFQQAQMFSLNDPRIVNLAVDGVFDDCQDLVKEVNADASFKVRHSLGAVNSINWARVVAQVVYYVVGYLRVTAETGGVIDVSVPTGNFGNICAAHIARQMGLPLGQLVLATNENNVLDEFFRTGVYRVRSSAEETSSPSMDISKASNFERFIFDLFGRDGARVRSIFAADLPGSGAVDLSGTPEFAAIAQRYGILSGSSSHADRLATIAQVADHDGYVLDPHTADAVKVGRHYARPGIPMLVTETALPVKFSATIVEALGIQPVRPAAFEGIEDLPRQVTGIPNDAGQLKQLIEQRLAALESR
ncbi:MAG: threonine synthase [Micropruina sp.]